MLLLSFRAPQHTWSPKQVFDLPLKEGKGRAKCHTFWALGQVSADAEPQSYSELTNCTGLELTSPFYRTHHLGRSANWKAADNRGWHTASGEARRGPPPEPGPHRGTELPDSTEVRQGCWLYISFLVRTTAFKSCLIAWNLFVLQSISCHTREHRELGTRRGNGNKSQPNVEKPHKDNSKGRHHSGALWFTTAIEKNFNDS